MQGKVREDISDSLGRYITLPCSPARSAARRQAGSHTHLFRTGKTCHEELRGNVLALQAYEHGKAVQKRRHEIDFCRGKGLYSYVLGIVHQASLRRIWAWAITKECFYK